MCRTINRYEVEASYKHPFHCFSRWLEDALKKHGSLYTLVALFTLNTSFGNFAHAEVKQEQPEHVEPAVSSALTRALLAFAVVVLFLSYLGSRLG